MAKVKSLRINTTIVALYEIKDDKIFISASYDTMNLSENDIINLILKIENTTIRMVSYLNSKS